METKHITLTIREIFELAKVVQVIPHEATLSESQLSDEDAETEYTIVEMSEGVQVKDDDGTIRRYRHTAYLDEYPEEGVLPLGNEMLCEESDLKDTGIEKRVKRVISEQLGLYDEVSSADRFLEDFGVDSLDTVELVMAFEYEFGIEVADEDAEKVTTVQEAIDAITEMVTNKKPGHEPS